MAQQPDGKAIVGGRFTTAGGAAHLNIARMDTGGGVDAGFTTGTSASAGSGDGSVTGIAIQEDGRILISGYFTAVNGTARSRLARLHPDGTLDVEFAPLVNGLIFATALQADGKILLGGGFTQVNGTVRNRLARLHSDGSLDTTFNPGASSDVYVLSPQPDGRILVGGSFITIGGVSRKSLARLQADGTVESVASFNTGTGPDGGVNHIEVQGDGKIVIAGSFLNVNGAARTRLARLLANGSLEDPATFAPVGPSPSVSDVTLQADGKILLGGGFDFFQSQPGGYRLARLDTIGKVDTTFVSITDANGHVYSLAPQADGKLLLGGGFTTLNGVSRQRMARLYMEPATGALTTSPAADVVWLRGGTAPELSYATFALSTDGGNIWTPLGVGSRIPGGWQLSAPGLPPDGLLRARGRAGGGLVETTAAFHISQSEMGVSGLGMAIADGDATPQASDGTDYGETSVTGGVVERTFVVSNTGSDPLHLSGTPRIAITGRDAGDFTVTAQPAAQVAPVGGTTEFSVRFNPTAAGVRTAAISIVSDDINERPYDFSIRGTGLGPVPAPVVSSNADNLYTTATALIVSGTGFSATPADNAVSLNNGAAGTVSACTETTLTISGLTGLTAGVLTCTVTTAGVSSGAPVQVATVIPAPGTVDTTFQPGISNGHIRAVLTQPDGKLIIGGQFTSVAGMTRNNIARLHPNGTLDTSFSASADHIVQAAALQNDGRIIITGFFSTVNGAARLRMARLNRDGSLDESFNTVAGADAIIASLAILPDGKILATGGIPNVRISPVRLQTDGSLDETFANGSNIPADKMVLQEDGRIVIFRNESGVRLVKRLLPDGAMEPEAAFNGPSLDGDVDCMTVQPDGKILIAGNFTAVHGQSRNRIARLNTDGSLDLGFNPGSGANDTVSGMVLQADGAILAGGSFYAFNGSTQNLAARLLPGGGLDRTFAWTNGLSGYVTGFCQQANGALFLGGGLLGPWSTRHLLRLVNYGARDSLLVSGAGTITWLREGAAPEISQALFDLSTDGGHTWTALGAGVRTAGGWQLTGLTLPANGEVRARGRMASGDSNGSSGLVETIIAYGSAAAHAQVRNAAGEVMVNGNATLEFGPVMTGESSPPQIVTVINTGTASMLLKGVTIAGGQAGDFAHTFPGYPVRLLAGQEFSFSVTFARPGPGVHGASLILTSSDPLEANYTVALSGTGIPSNNAALDYLGLNYLSTTALPVEPPFAAQVTDYVVAVPSIAATLNVGLGPAQSNATLRLNGAVVAPGAYTGVPVSPGENVILVTVTAQDGITTRNYRVQATRAVQPAGYVDQLFNFPASATGTAVQPDGRILLFGSFTQAGNSPRRYLVRLTPQGVLETAFDPSPDASVSGAAVLPDGKMVIFGAFTTVAGTARRGLARLFPDGTVDPNFDPGPDAAVLALAVQPDGKLLIAGYFNTVQGAARSHLARLNADGTLDDTFNPPSLPALATICLQPDGKILIGGYFSTVGTATRNNLARLNADGTLDTPFTAGTNGGVTAIALQDSLILIGGSFDMAGGSARPHLARFTAAGALDTAFNPGLGGGFVSVDSLILQADSKILVAGYFTGVGPVTRYSLARLNPTGTLDTSFVPGTPANTPNINSVACQADGKVLACGDFTDLFGIPRAGFARLENDAATQNLTVPLPDRVIWQRSGSAPQALAVSFELSTDGGETWTALGSGTRGGGAWILAGLDLPAAGSIRARARTAGGYRNSSSGLVEAVAPFGAIAPQMVVEYPPGTALSDEGERLDFGAAVTATDGSTRTFVIKNTGTAALHLPALTITGAHPADFILHTENMLTLIPPGGQTAFAVTFVPAGTGTRSATLRITSTVAADAFFRIPLGGTGIASSNAALASLQLSAGTLAPDFTAPNDSYSARVPNHITRVTVTALTAHAGAAVTVNGDTSPAAVSLAEGSNRVAITVRAEDGITVRHYTVDVTRAGPAAGDFENGLGGAIGNEVMSIMVQPDAKIVLGGQFPNLLRRRADGTADVSFLLSIGDFTGSDPSVFSTIYLPDGNILAGGDFDMAGGFSRSNILRLRPAGVVDAAFNPGTNNTVRSMALQTDGKILLAGDFTTVAGVTRNHLARLNADGALDTAFNPGANAVVRGLALQPDGRILLAGEFTVAGGVSAKYLARVNADGSVDASFKPQPNGFTRSLSVQPDGGIIIGGDFAAIQGTTRHRLARLHPDGTLDNTFNADVDESLSTTVYSTALQADGKIVAGGIFSRVGGANRRHIARLHSDGTLDAGFDPDASSSVLGVALQADGKIILGGHFITIGGVVSPGSARLRNDPAAQRLTAPGSTRIQWLRGGSAPEAQTVSFDFSTSGGGPWTPLGSGMRIPGGWELTGLSLPAAGHIRARARVGGGVYNVSSGIIETVMPFPLTPLENWRLQHFSVHTSTGSAADPADPDNDDIPNLVEYALLLNPLENSVPLMPKWQFTGGTMNLALTGPQPEGVILTAEWNDDPADLDWAPIPDTGTAPARLFTLPAAGMSKAFLRLRVLIP